MEETESGGVVLHFLRASAPIELGEPVDMGGMFIAWEREHPNAVEVATVYEVEGDGDHLDDPVWVVARLRELADEIERDGMDYLEDEDGDDAR